MTNSTQNTPDVLVVGAGVLGLAVAFEALRAGLSVHVLEAAHPGAGASGGIVGALSPHVPDQWNAKKAFQFSSLCRAPEFWAAVARAGGLPTGYRSGGRIMPLRDEAAIARAEARRLQAAENWGQAARWEVVPASAHSWADDGAVLGFVEETLSAQIHPGRATAALAAAVRALGGTISEAQAVWEFGDGWVRTAGGIQNAGAVVVAAGLAGFALLAPHLGDTPGSGVKGQAAMLDADLPAGAPVYFDDGVYVIRHGAGQVAVGSTSERVYEHATTTDDALDALIATAQARLPSLAGAPVRERWAGVRPKARRRDPMLGPIPGMERAFAALGGFKIGFGIAPEVARITVAALRGTPAPLPETFSVSHHLKRG